MDCSVCGFSMADDKFCVICGAESENEIEISLEPGIMADSKIHSLKYNQSEKTSSTGNKKLPFGLKNAPEFTVVKELPFGLDDAPKIT